MQVDTDVLVIGGGANGTGLARDLAKRGLRVMLCEKGDLARGATGAASGMIHGGPRYLLNDVETTKHSQSCCSRRTRTTGASLIASGRVPITTATLILRLPVVPQLLGQRRAES